MSIQSPINSTSLKLVYEELLATLKQSAGKLEQFTAHRDDGEPLQGAIEDLRQSVGIIDVVQIPGADLLSKAMLVLLQDIPVGESAQADARLGELTTAYFLLFNYLEYCSIHRKALPILVLPTINTLRHFMGQAPIPDSHFFEVDTGLAVPPSTTSLGTATEDVAALARRLRHMYQVGFLQVLNGQQLPPSLGMMARAVSRVTGIASQRPSFKLWRLADLALQALLDNGMEVYKNRKLLFGQLDRQLKALAEAGEAGLDIDPPALILKELLYIIALSGGQQPEIKEVLAAFNISDTKITEKDVIQEREALSGPNSATISSLITVLQDEINRVKGMLEATSESGFSPGQGTAELAGELQKIADILVMVGLGTPSNCLKADVEALLAGGDAPGEAGSGVVEEVADTLLYIESTVKSLEHTSLSKERLEAANTLSKAEVIASVQLADAENGVLHEAAAGLVLVKRALSAFTESGFDSHHIANVPSTLNGVRGVLTVLNLPRAMAVVNSSIRFVSEALLGKSLPAAVESQLETFADAIIGLEYYIDALHSDREADDNVLRLAEDSLDALGYPVNG